MPDPHAYEVGQPYSSRMRFPVQETGQYNYRGGHHELVLFYRQPSPGEIDAAQRGEAEFALLPWPSEQEPHVLFLLYRFGDRKLGIDWSDASYSWHLVPETERQLPAELGESERPVLLVLLVDADLGTIRARPRIVSLAPAFGVALHALIRRQSELDFSPAGYDRQIADAYRRYPSSAAMLHHAVIHAKGGI